MKTNEKGIKLLHVFEGCKLQAYICPAGKFTIGWGSTRYEDGKSVQLGDKITQERADQLFENILKDFEDGVRIRVKKPLNENQFSALTSFAYNVGLGNFGSSTLLKLVNKNPNDPEIRTQFMRWNKGGGKVLNGLTRRRNQNQTYTLMQKFRDISPLAYLILGIVLGLVVYGFFLKPEVETKVVESIKIKTEIDSVAHKETVRLSNYIDSLELELGKKPPIEHEFIRDTVLLEGWKPKINRFRAIFPNIYGNAYLSGEVLGEVLNTELTNDFKLPVITNTITKEKTTTNTIIQRGLFVGGGFANTMDYSLGAAYLGNGFLINVDYTPNPKFMEQSLIQANIKINPFRIKKRN